MANIIIQNWDETPAERQLRQRGYSKTEAGCMEAGTSMGAWMLRKNNAGEAMREVGKILFAIHNAMADQGWDDDKVCITVGIQARNGWECIDEEWVETGSPQWLDATTRKALKGK